MSRPLVLVSAGLILAAALVMTIVLVPAEVVDIYQPTTQVEVPLQGKIGQSFVAPSDGLSSIGFFFSTTADVDVRLELAASDPDSTVRSVSKTLSAAQKISVGSPPPIWFEFRPVKDSAGQRFTAVLSASKQGTSVLRSMGESYPAGAAVVSGKRQPFDLAIAIKHRGSVGERIGRLGRWVPAGVVIGLLIALATLCFLAVSAVAKGYEEGAASGGAVGSDRQQGR